MATAKTRESQSQERARKERIDGIDDTNTFNEFLKAHVKAIGGVKNVK